MLTIIESDGASGPKNKTTLLHKKEKKSEEIKISDSFFFYTTPAYQIHHLTSVRFCKFVTFHKLIFLDAFLGQLKLSK